jgi:hypothetical protein
MAPWHMSPRALMRTQRSTTPLRRRKKDRELTNLNVSLATLAHPGIHDHHARWNSLRSARGAALPMPADLSSRIPEISTTSRSSRADPLRSVLPHDPIFRTSISCSSTTWPSGLSYYRPPARQPGRTSPARNCHVPPHRAKLCLLRPFRTPEFHPATSRWRLMESD